MMSIKRRTKHLLVLPKTPSMRKALTALIFIAFSLHTGAQQPANTMDLLAPVNTLEQAKSFIASHPKLEGKLFMLDSGNDTMEIAVPLYEQKPGYSFQVGNYSYKIISIDSALASRATYVYLDGEKYSRIEINQLRKQIIAKYKAGAPFDDLVTEYNMDGNRTGDPGWFTKGMMVQEFETAVRAHKKNDIFTIDIPDRNWYYVVLKTFDETYIRKLTLLKIRNN